MSQVVIFIPSKLLTELFDFNAIFFVWKLTAPSLSGKWMWLSGKWFCLSTCSTGTVNIFVCVKSCNGIKVLHNHICMGGTEKVLKTWKFSRGSVGYYISDSLDSIPKKTRFSRTAIFNLSCNYGPNQPIFKQFFCLKAIFFYSGEKKKQYFFKPEIRL